MKGILKALTAVMFNIIAGTMLAAAAGIPGWVGAAGMNAVGAVMSLAPNTAGVALEGVYREVWTGECVKKLRGGLAGSWLDGIPDNSTLVENDVIHLVKIGVQPEVLIDNTTYPIPRQAVNDADIAIKLSKFQTKPTAVTDDELHAISYDKMARVVELHANALDDAKFMKAAHALCANKNTDETPVLKLKGDSFSYADLVAMKEAMDNQGVPAEGRRAVLSASAINGLLLTNQSFERQYNIDRNTGKVGHLAGFDIYQYNATPVYDKDGNKKAVGSIAGAGESRCSFAFYEQRVFKATGSTKMYYRDAATDPDNQESVVNYRHYFICMPKVADCGVVVLDSPRTTSEPEKQPAQTGTEGNDDEQTDA